MSEEEQKVFIQDFIDKAYKDFNFRINEKDPIVLQILASAMVNDKLYEQQLDLLLSWNSSSLKLISDWNEREQETLNLVQTTVQSFIDNLLSALKVDFINSFITKFKEENKKEREIFFKRQEKILKEYKSVKFCCFLTSAVVLGDLILRFI